MTRIFRPLLAAAGRLAGAALLALLLTQSAALIHAIEHTPLSSLHSAQGGEGGEGDRWGHEVDTLSCVVMDHLVVGQHIDSDASTTPSLRTPCWLAPLPTECVASGDLLLSYRARGPPAS